MLGNLEKVALLSGVEVVVGRVGTSQGEGEGEETASEGKAACMDQLRSF
jgi:hypothetical protein